ncbi:hypothetical protein [Marinobacter sp. SS21]|uniref:hypothetical protein n=1 Tax=Marinobacter sp. SS21 TaxID=2979460 RepID=UPI00232CD526|nr:hypothetical protein [Marinobacter sp. SS21]MDC0661346.1 hypothetical protein [Marinobacter sp. SS21]
MAQSQQPDRRKLRRMPAANLALEWRPRKGLFGRFRPAAGFDFTRQGLSMVVNGQYLLKEGDAVELRAQLSMEAGVLDLDKLIAKVCNLRHSGQDQQIAGLQFDFTASRAMKSDQVKAQLGRIEGILERSEKLRLRIQPLEAFGVGD